MAGIIDSRMVPVEAEQEQLQPQGQQGGPQEKSVEIVRRMGLAAMKIIYDPQVSAQIVGMIQSEEPVESVANAAVMVLERLREQTKGVEPSSVYVVGPAVAVFIMELGEAAGVIQPDEAMLSQVIEAMAEMAPQGATKEAQTTQPEAPVQPQMGAV